MAAEPTFAEMRDELIAWVRLDARLNEIAEPFIAGLEVNVPGGKVPGITDAWNKMQRRAVVFAAAFKAFDAMAPHEAEHRALMTGGAPPAGRPAASGH